MIDAHHGWNKDYKPQVYGFLLSIIFTLVTYFIAVKHYATGTALLIAVFGLSLAQAAVQLVFFFHIGLESKPRWNLIIFLFLVLVMIVIIGGSMWIMYNLNYNMAMPGMKI